MHDRIVDRRRSGFPEPGDIGLCLGSRRAVFRADRLDLVVIAHPYLTREGWRGARSKLVARGHDPRLALRPLRNCGNHGGDVCAGGRSRPVPFGRSRVVPRAPSNNSRGGLFACGDPRSLRRAIGNRGERAPVGFVDRGLLRGHQARQHRAVGCRHCCSNRRIGHRIHRNAIGGISFSDGVDSLVDGGLYHGERPVGGRWPQAGGHRDIGGSNVPVCDHVSRRHRPRKH